MLVEPRHESLLHQTWVEYGRSAPSLTALSQDEDDKIRGSAGAATSDAGTWTSSSTLATEDSRRLYALNYQVH